MFLKTGKYTSLIIKIAVIKTKIAILGVGRWGIHFVRNFLNHPQVKLVAIVDASQKNLSLVRKNLILILSRLFYQLIGNLFAT